MADDQITELRALARRGRSRPARRGHGRAGRCRPPWVWMPPTSVLEARFHRPGRRFAVSADVSRVCWPTSSVSTSPGGVVIDPTGDLMSVTNYLERETCGRQAPTDVRLGARCGCHRSNGRPTSPWTRFIDHDILKTATTLPAPTAAVRAVLLTGATGFLGRFLALEWLERLAAGGGTLICLTRGNRRPPMRRQRNRVGARHRSRSAANGSARSPDGPPGSAGQRHQRAQSRTRRGRLESVGHQTSISSCTPAAHVNHVLPYPQLFQANRSRAPPRPSGWPSPSG